MCNGCLGEAVRDTGLDSPTGGIGLGIFGGLLSVFLGLRPHLREALDDEEHRELVRFGHISAVVVVAAALGFTLTGVLASAVLGIATQLTVGGAMTAL